MDARCFVLAWNQLAFDTFGWSAAEAIGRPLAELIVPVQHQVAHAAGLDRYLTSKGQRAKDGGFWAADLSQEFIRQ